MVGMDHKPASAEVHDPATSARNARIGLMLFAAYLLLYGGFVVINAFAPERMDQIVWGGLNVAVLYGFALILSAFVLSLVYGWLVRNPANRGSGAGKGAGQ